MTSSSRSPSRTSSTPPSTRLGAGARPRRSAVFWVVALDEAIDRETVELFRSKEILSRKERGAQTKDETALVSEEKRRQRRHQDELRRLLRQALPHGHVSSSAATTAAPTPSATDVGERRRQCSRRPSRGLRPLRRGRGPCDEEGPRRSDDEREPPGPHAGLQRPAPRADGERASRARRRERPARGGSRLGSRTRRATARCRAAARSQTIRGGAVRLGVRDGPPVRARAPARREDPGDERGPADRVRVSVEARNVFATTTSSGRRRSSPRRGSSSRRSSKRPSSSRTRSARGRRARAGRRRARDPGAGRAIRGRRAQKRTRLLALERPSRRRRPRRGARAR